MDKKLIGEIVLFIIIEIVGLIPVGIHFLVKKTSENEKGDLAVMLTRNVMFRALLSMLFQFQYLFSLAIRELQLLYF